DVYDPEIVFPDPLVRRTLRREVDERVAGDGGVLEPLDVAGARAVVGDLLRDGAEAVAVCLLHSYINAGYELLLFNLMREAAPDIPVSLSHQVLPQIREYERTSATVINAYVQPMVRGYLRALDVGLRRLRFTGQLYLMTSRGSIMTVQTAMDFPLHLVE